MTETGQVISNATTSTFANGRIAKNGSEPALSFTSVSKTYVVNGTPIRALDDVSFSVPPATIVGVIGTSGAGKSTVFRCASALEQPDSGTIHLAGQDLASASGASLRRARKNVGLVFQQLHLLPSRTAYENVVLPLELAGNHRDASSMSRARDRARELLGWVGLRDRADSYPKHLSGGQRQRVAIARALATSPAVLLCDEPTSALDPTTTGAIVELLHRVRDDLGVAVLIITHEMGVVRALCDRVVALEAGRVMSTGVASDVFDDDRRARRSGALRSVVVGGADR